MSMVRVDRCRALLGTTLLALVLVGCGNDGNDAPFNANGLSEDMAAAQAAFDSPVAQSLGTFGSSIDNAFVAPVVSGSFGALHAAATHKGMTEASRRMAASVQSLTGGQKHVALALIPAEYLGDTFTYDAGTDQYTVSERTGAPANGVRFILYAVNPVTREPVEPLQEIGYLDVLDTSTGTTDALRIQLVSDGTMYADYGIAGSVGASSAQAVVDGFITDGTNRVDFDLDTSISDAGGGRITYDYEMDVANRDVSFDYLIVLTGLMTGTANATIDLSVSGPNGTVGMEGGLVNDAGVVTAFVNGDAFAVITLDAEGDVAGVTKPDGSELTNQERGAMLAIWAIIFRGFDWFEDLLDPVDNLL